MHPALHKKSIAVLIDYENLALGTGRPTKKVPGLHQNAGPRPDMKLVLNELLKCGRIVSKKAYCDWNRFQDAVTPLHELGIELIEIPDRAVTGKNSADIRLAVDAVEMCLTREPIDTFAILSGDSDFSPVVSKLKEYGKYVIGVGMQASTSSLLSDNCDEFIFYEELLEKEAGKGGTKKTTQTKRTRSVKAEQANARSATTHVRCASAIAQKAANSAGEDQDAKSKRTRETSAMDQKVAKSADLQKNTNTKSARTPRGNTKSTPTTRVNATNALEGIDE